MENASRAFLDAARKSMRQIRTVIGTTTIDPKLLTAERLQYEGYLRREETNGAVLALSKNGIPIKQIVRQTGHSRKMVRQVVRGERHDVFRARQSSLDLQLPLRSRRAERADTQNFQRIPSARTIARLMTIGQDLLTKAETVTVAAIEAGVPTLVEAREIIAEFHLMIQRKTQAGLIAWIERACASLVASFASGVARDEAAVRAAITLPWSNGQIEGQITRLKLVRPQMYCHGKIDLLQARLIGAE
ncbi:hypothetical protein CI41S_21040 [Bradyrhizobium ivorense]|nr:hypothetical protein CI41S_21040 [Bradyrhizobium ivorense]